jgi:hypothetical protein
VAACAKMGIPYAYQINTNDRVTIAFMRVSFNPGGSRTRLMQEATFSQVNTVDATSGSLYCSFMFHSFLARGILIQ